MIKFNELIIDGVKTSSFPYKIIIENAPEIALTNSKTILTTHEGMTGYIVQTNKQREILEKQYTIHLVKPTEQQLYEFSDLLSREGFWLENDQTKLTKLWCYRVQSFVSQRSIHGVYTIQTTFICHPTKFFKNVDTQTLESNGTLLLHGNALAFPTITITKTTAQDTTFTVNKQVIRLGNQTGTLTMVNDPKIATFKTQNNDNVLWSGDFVTLDPSQGKRVGVILGSGISKIKFDVLWGWK